MGVEVQPYFFSVDCRRIEGQSLLPLLDFLTEEGVLQPVCGLGLCDVGVWRKKRNIIGISCEFLQIADLDVEPNLFEVLASEFLLRNFLWLLDFRRLFRRLVLDFRSFLCVLGVLLLLFLLFLLLLDLRLLFLDFLDLHVLLAIEVGQGNMLSYV